MILGVTGGIGSGKSTVAQIFRKMHIPVLEADDLAHQLLRNPGIKKKIVSLWGKNVLQDREIDRKWLARKIFSSPEERWKLEEILHPPIIRIIRKEIQKARKMGKDLVVVVPLLLEKGLEGLFDQIWVVTAPHKERIHRICVRDGVSGYSVRKRISSQMHEWTKRSKADRIISTFVPLPELEKEIHRLWNEVKKSPGSPR
ncbi:MAG: dephospho-CoA kinase [bacterium JZ-2024 1]